MLSKFSRGMGARLAVPRHLALSAQCWTPKAGDMLQALLAAEHRDSSAAHRIPQLQQQELLPPHQHPSDPSSTNYSQPGPFVIARLPCLEHTCHKLFPACVGTQCLLRCSIFYPRSPPPGDGQHCMPLRLCSVRAHTSIQP